MREVIQKMVEAEGDAKRLLDEAKTAADRLLGEARRQAQGLLEQSRGEAKAAAAKVVESAVQEDEREKKERLAREIAAVEAETRMDDAVRRAAVEAVVKAVSSQNA
ncbi:MAG: hypothetical protein NT049_13535 [Planctomycetota bacterium]|nr:hypothetical protein [Planctomycetota bacterium]